MELLPHAATALLLCVLLAAASPGVSSFRTGIAEYESRRAEESTAASQGCFWTRLRGFSKSDYRFQLEVQEYPGVKASLAVKLHIGSRKPTLTTYWHHAWTVSYKNSFTWQMSPTDLTQRDGRNEINLLDVLSISYSEIPEKGMCLNIEHEGGTWTELCGGTLLKEEILKNANVTWTSSVNPIDVLLLEIGPEVYHIAKGFADGVLGRGPLADIVGLRTKASRFIWNATHGRARSMSMAKKMFDKLKCHSAFKRCPDRNFLVPHGRSCSKSKTPDNLAARSVNQLALPEDPGKKMAVRIDCPTWMRMVNVELLSAKGRSAILYKYDSSDVGQGIARVLKLPRSVGLEKILVDEAKQVPILSRLGVNVPECNYCKVTYHGTDLQEHETMGLIKELMQGLDLADIIAAAGLEDSQFDADCLPKRLKPVDPDAVNRIVGNRTKTQEWAHSLGLATGFQGHYTSRRKKLAKKIQSALECLFARFAFDLLQAHPKGLFMDLSARNLMWGTLRRPQDVDTLESYRLWVVDSMPFLPGTREFHHLLERGPSEAWETVYAKPWNHGPGQCSSKSWKKFEVPNDPDLVARDWLPSCNR